MPKKCLLLCCVFLFVYVAHAQADSITTGFVLKRIASLQVKQDKLFLSGSYPTYINNKQRCTIRKGDINIFYNLVIDVTLKKLRPKLDKEQQILVDTLLARSAKIYPRFLNKSRGSYNFWLRDSAYRFPLSWWIPLIKKDGNVPDDMDDTALEQLVNTNDSAEALHQMMQQFIHFPNKKIKSADKKYRSYNAYSTWFGKKFPVVFDAAVLCNILTFVQTYNLAWTHADSASLKLIEQVIKNGDYIQKPLEIAPNYGKTSILLYHFSRLMEVKKIPSLDSLKPLLVKESRELLVSSKNILEQIILANALHRFGEKATIVLPPKNEMEKQIEQNDFPFVIGNIPSYFSNTFKKLFYKSGWLLYYYYCPAYNDALLLEYLVNKENNP
ncbi:hypothetical protein A9P82_09500 [Arachidicoccus ginsenosidimutans]|uniref:hypothetical protein n=1 Tax=Arachidicoccus sp. BS20 TaxID=1850526 RepID=UPI0007F1488F|nr:hypothetical protein [Arachidicoccus sp. BS20]ANI89502.1 hypothetical protein A9P82_09500 [Arachidicoccus sp. BS20]